MDSELSEFLLKSRCRCTKDLSYYLFFAMVVNVVTEFAREDVLSELLYADDLLLVSVTIQESWNKFLEW